MSIIINPGSGPVEGGSYDDAYANMGQLCEESGCKIVTVSARSHEGRYTFTVLDRHGREREVDMPGLPLARVRFVGDPEQDIWDFPRLYVDGSSWVWKFAVSALARRED